MSIFSQRISHVSYGKIILIKLLRSEIYCSFYDSEQISLLPHKKSTGKKMGYNFLKS